ncbi:MAG: N-acyl homoserine lactonase family protein [Chloroflexi bacterium]|nr:N-acyl homoserine lactonase family protein [Chloroflexota bacterium]
MSANQYRAYAIRYGHRDNVPAHEAFHRPHAAPAGGMDYFVWLITDGQTNIVVDTGFGEAEGTRRGRQFLRSPERGLAELGVDAARVEHVVLSHFHYDHIGGTALFPNATFYVQEQEMRFYTGAGGSLPVIRESIHVPDLLALLELNYAGRVKFVDVDAEIVPGVSVHKASGHTPGMQFVSLDTSRGRAVLTSDASHYYANMEEANVFNTFVDLVGVLRGHQRIRETASSPDLILPGHDPLVLQRLTRVADGIVEL